MGGLGRNDLGLLQIVHPELLEAGLEEFFLFRLQVPLSPVLEEVEHIDEPSGQVEIHLFLCLVRVAQQAQVEEGLGIKRENDGAEIEGGQELRILFCHRRPCCALSVSRERELIFIAAWAHRAGAVFFLRSKLALMNSSRSPSRTLSTSPVSSRVRKSLI